MGDGRREGKDGEMQPSQEQDSRLHGRHLVGDISVVLGLRFPGDWFLG